MHDVAHKHEKANTAILQRITGIFVERAATEEESGRLLMATK
jgi:hypothetical protein